LEGWGNLGVYMQNRHDTPSFVVDGQSLLVDGAALITIMQAIFVAYRWHQASS